MSRLTAKLQIYRRCTTTDRWLHNPSCSLQSDYFISNNHIPFPKKTILILSFHLLLDVPSVLFPSGFSTQTLYTPFLSPIHATCPANLILLDLITRKILCVRDRLLNSSLCSFLHSLLLRPLRPNILLSTLFSNTLTLHFSLNVSDQVSHP